MGIGKRISQWAVPVLLVTAAACGGSDNAADESADMSAAPPPAAAPAVDSAAAPATGAVASANLPEGVTPAMVQEGQQIFTSNGNCYTCHGPNAEGTALAPSLTDQEWIWVTPGPNEYAELQERIKEGVPQPKAHPAPMPPMGGVTLTDDQLKAVSAYVYSLTNKG